MRPIFCGNFEFDARQSDLERLFRRYGKVDKVDMKSGFAFIYMFDERDAEDAIRALDRIEFGRKGRRLRVEWSKEERGRKPESSRKPSSNTSRPTKTLFVINFDPYNTKTRDLERHFDPYGKILNVRIRRNFAFIQYETLEDATKALDATNMSKLLDRVITVEFAIKDDDERKSGYSPDRNHGRSPRRSHGRGRSPSPYARERESPDYGHGHARSRSPYRRERASPEYGRGSSPVPHGRGRNSEYGHGRSQSPSPRKDTIRSHDRSPSPRKERSRSENGHKSSPRKRPSPDYERRMGRGDLVEKKNSVSPEDYDRDQWKKDRVSPDDYDRDQRKKVRVSPDDYDRDQSPSPNPEVMDSPAYGGSESPINERDGSRTPPLQERSRS